jgi:hypothetical protein
MENRALVAAILREVPFAWLFGSRTNDERVQAQVLDLAGVAAFVEARRPSLGLQVVSLARSFLAYGPPVEPPVRDDVRVALLEKLNELAK